jgi:hypothetical protein
LASAGFVLGAISCSNTEDKFNVGTLDGGGDGGGLLPDGAFDPDTSGDENPIILPESLTLTPANATVYIDTATTPATPGKLTFVGTLNASDGTTSDVTSQLTFTLDDTSLGSFSGPDFTSVASLPGSTQVATTTVHATGASKIALANLTVVQIRKSGTQRDFFFVVPYNGPPSPTKDVLGFGTDLKNADVVFSVDTTGSMTGSINNLKANLNTMFPQLVAKIPSVGLGVVDFKDTENGCGNDAWVVNPRQRINATTNAASLATAAANAMSAIGGCDEPEADIVSLTYIAQGSYPTAVKPALANYTPPAPFWGGVNFRPGSVPIVVNVTDATWKQNSGGIGALAPVNTLYSGKNIRFVGVTDTHQGVAENEVNTLSDATKSNLPPAAFGTSGQCPTGSNTAGAVVSRPPVMVGGASVCRLNFTIYNGSPLTNTVVTAISAIAIGSTFDITAIPSNDATNAGGVDATKFIKSLRAMDEGDTSEGCAALGASKVKDTNADGVADTFIQITASKSNRVCFEVNPEKNTIVPPTNVAQIFRAFIDVVGMPGAVNLGDRRQVLFLVPPKDITTQ